MSLIEFGLAGSRIEEIAIQIEIIVGTIEIGEIRCKTIDRHCFMIT